MFMVCNYQHTNSVRSDYIYSLAIATLKVFIVFAVRRFYRDEMFIGNLLCAVL